MSANQISPSSPRSEVEELKEASNLLRGSIAQELDAETTTFDSGTGQLLKFHGVYLQDNRDVRSARVRARQDLEHICMIRVAIPGGVLSPEQYLALDTLADTLGNGSLRLTTRQGIQFHFVTKANLRDLISQINASLLTTWGGCGDVVRNVTACPSSDQAVRDLGVNELANEISLRYKAPSAAYYELWVDGDKVPNDIVNAPSVEDSIYGQTMLPRKFKIGVTTSDDNCIDILTCDLGVVIDASDPTRVRIYGGGGLGRSGTDETTFARIGDLFGEVDRNDVTQVCDAIIGLQRDEGNRKDRAHARFKYLVEAWGVERIRQEITARSAVELRMGTPDLFPHTSDHLGRSQHTTSTNYDYGIKLPSGRIKDLEPARYKSAIGEIVRTIGRTIAITARGDFVVTDVTNDDIAIIEEIMKSHAVPTQNQLSKVALASFACVALPTCGLALAESERYLPTFLERLEGTLRELDIANADIEVRMTGCPNGCARPYLGEIGIVGRSKRSYDLFIGADRNGTRMNSLFARDVVNDNLVPSLKPLLALWAKEREVGEGFGDFYHRLDPQVIEAHRPPERRRVCVSSAKEEGS